MKVRRPVESGRRPAARAPTPAGDRACSGESRVLDRRRESAALPSVRPCC